LEIQKYREKSCTFQFEKKEVMVMAMIEYDAFTPELYVNNPRWDTGDPIT